MKKNIGWVTYFITSCDVCNNHWDAVVHMETFDSDTQVSSEWLDEMSIKMTMPRSSLRQVGLATLDQLTLTTMALLDLKDSQGGRDSG